MDAKVPLRKPKRKSPAEAVSVLGQAVRGSRTGRPLMALLDLLGRRWTLRVLWELREETLNFRELQSRCDRMSPSVLNQRLAELKGSGIVQVLDEGGYRLTEEGRDLISAIAPLDSWAKRWARREAGPAGPRSQS
jgi:DNA-binding HxlR family transcriptional regulator